MITNCEIFEAIEAARRVAGDDKWAVAMLDRITGTCNRRVARGQPVTAEHGSNRMSAQAGSLVLGRAFGTKADTELESTLEHMQAAADVLRSFGF